MSEGSSARRARRRFVYIASGICALGGLLFGYDTGVISGALLFLKKDLGIQHDAFMQGLVTSAILIGAMIGALVCGSLADRLGRRRLTLLAGVVFGIGAIGAAASPDVAVLILFRIVLGIGVGLASVIVPMYIAEISPAEVRGRLTSLNQLMITVGILVAYIIDYLLAPYAAWRWMFGLAVIPAAALFIGMYFMPETPRWLVSHGQLDVARQVLGRTRGEERIEEEIEGIQEAERRAREQAGWGELVKAWIRPALIVGLGLAILQQFVGINTIIYYAPTTLTKLGLGDSASILAQVGIGVVNVLFTFVAIRTLDTIGRKKLLLAGSVGMTASLAVLGFLTLAVGIKGGAIGIITIICLAVYIASFAATWGPTVWVMLPEIYPLRVRGPAEGLATWGNWASNFVVSLTFPSMLAGLGQGPSMLMFAGMGVISFLFVLALVPETKGKTLEEIEEELNVEVEKAG